MSCGAAREQRQCERCVPSMCVQSIHTLSPGSFHLEAFVAQVMSLIKSSLAGMDWE